MNVQVASCFCHFSHVWEVAWSYFLLTQVIFLSWVSDKVKGTLILCWWECKLVQQLWKSVWRFLRKLGVNLPQDPAIPLLGIYPRDAQSYYKSLCSAMFIAVLFVIARTWKQLRCSLMEEWIKKVWHIYTLEYYSVVKTNDILNFACKWMEVENALQSEVSQTQKRNMVCIHA